MTEPAHAISLTDVTFRYKAEVAVDGLSFTVRPGEIFGIVGPDGAGKTTTIRMLCGLLDPAAGLISVLGFDTVKHKTDINANIGYLSQRFSLYGDLTVDENIDFFAEIHDVKDFRKRKQDLLDFTRLTPFRKRLADRLSGGMKQKLALACTLIHTPRLIYLDEPTTGVDPVSRRDFWKILNNLLMTGLTIVMSTPYLDEAERCNRVALMNRGRIMMCDAPDRVRRTLKADMLEIVCQPLREAVLHCRTSGMFSSVQMFGDRIHVGYNGKAHSPADIQKLLEGKGVVVEAMRPLVPTLEDVFIQLMEEGARQ